MESQHDLKAPSGSIWLIHHITAVVNIANSNMDWLGLCIAKMSVCDSATYICMYSILNYGIDALSSKNSNNKIFLYKPKCSLPKYPGYREKQKRWATPGERWRGWLRTDNSGVPWPMAYAHSEQTGISK